MVYKTEVAPDSYLIEVVTETELTFSYMETTMGIINALDEPKDTDRYNDALDWVLSKIESSRLNDAVEMLDKYHTHM